jgi:hypothetical protein
MPREIGRRILGEMNAADAAIAAGLTDELPKNLSDRWLADLHAVRLRGMHRKH